MKRFHLHPNDLIWLKRWLRSNLCLVIIVGSLVIAVRHRSIMPIASGHAADAEAAVELPPETELVLIPSRPSNPVAPEGWRRTSRGWEHVSNWPSPNKSINQLIAAQHELEPAWIRFAFAKVRGIPPLMIALMQLTAVAVIVNVSRSRRTASRS